MIATGDDRLSDFVSAALLIYENEQIASDHAQPKVLELVQFSRKRAYWVLLKANPQILNDLEQVVSKLRQEELPPLHAILQRLREVERIVW